MLNQTNQIMIHFVAIVRIHLKTQFERARLQILSNIGLKCDRIKNTLVGLDFGGCLGSWNRPFGNVNNTRISGLKIKRTLTFFHKKIFPKCLEKKYIFSVGTELLFTQLNTLL